MLTGMFIIERELRQRLLILRFFMSVKLLASLCGMSKEHRISLVWIRCMTKDYYKKLKKIWQELGGKPDSKR